MSPTSPAAPTPAPAPAAAAKPRLTVKAILTDITVALAAVATIGEGVLAALPSGPVHTAAAVALPIVVSLVASLRKLGG